jgi:hypothetical protein
MAPAYHRAFESKHFYFHTGHGRGWTSRCVRKWGTVLADVYDCGGSGGHGDSRARNRPTDYRSLVSFEPSDSGPSSRYSISLDLENEDRDWSFEVTVTMEF